MYIIQNKFDFYTPRNEVRGGVYWNHHVRLSDRPFVRLSVRPSAFGFPAHNCFPFTPIIMKLHMQTPHEARMCPIDFEVKRSRSRSQCINYWKWFPAHNCFPFTPIIMKLHMQTPHEARMCPIDFEVKRSKVKVTMHKLLKMVSFLEKLSPRRVFVPLGQPRSSWIYSCILLEVMPLINTLGPVGVLYCLSNTIRMRVPYMQLPCAFFLYFSDYNLSIGICIKHTITKWQFSVKGS